MPGTTRPPVPRCRRTLEEVTFGTAAFEAVQESRLSLRLELAFGRVGRRRSTRHCLGEHFADRLGPERLSVRS